VSNSSVTTVNTAATNPEASADKKGGQ